MHLSDISVRTTDWNSPTPKKNIDQLRCGRLPSVGFGDLQVGSQFNCPLKNEHSNQRDTCNSNRERSRCGDRELSKQTSDTRASGGSAIRRQFHAPVEIGPEDACKQCNRECKPPRSLESDRYHGDQHRGVEHLPCPFSGIGRTLGLLQRISSHGSVCGQIFRY